MKRYLLLIISLCLMLSTVAQSSQHDHLPELERSQDYSDTSNFAQNLLAALNFFRMNPSEAAELYEQSPMYDRKSRNDRSLIKELKTMEPITEAIVWDSLLYEAAICHAQTSGADGHKGHTRIADCPEDFNAECIQYGIDRPDEIIISLLEDTGVSSLIHRKILLSAELTRLGAAQAHHSTYRVITVIDFAR